MITPYVEIIKDANGDLLDDTVVVSVLTCAAPMISHGKEGMSESEYEDMVYNRIMGMLKCVAYLGYRHLVLGAWGCGAFGNDAHVISDLFYKALKEMNYNKLREKDLFRRIVPSISRKYRIAEGIIPAGHGLRMCRSFIAAEHREIPVCLRFPLRRTVKTL